MRIKGKISTGIVTLVIVSLLASIVPAAGISMGKKDKPQVNHPPAGVSQTLTEQDKTAHLTNEQENMLQPVEENEPTQHNEIDQPTGEIPKNSSSQLTEENNTFQLTQYISPQVQTEPIQSKVADSQNENVIILDKEKISEYLKSAGETYEQWQERTEYTGVRLPREKELELYDQGYDFYDIQVAKELAGLCGKRPEDLLTLKGKTIFEVENGNIVDKSKPWDDVIKGLDIKFIKPTDAFGITHSQINEMKQQGLSDRNIQEAAILSFNYKKEYKSILKEIKKGKTVKGLKKEYWEEKNNSLKEQKVSKVKAEENTEKILKRQYNITNDDIKKAKEYGIEKIVDIAMAKGISGDDKVKFEDVLKAKRDKGSWKDVNAQMGGE